jgi:ribose transport system permease protein
MSKVKKLLRSNNITLIAVLIVIIVVFTLLNKNYVSVSNLTNIFYAANLPGIIAIGGAMLLICGHVDLAAGAIAAFAGVLCAKLIAFGIPWPFAIIIVLIYGLIAGAINAILVNKFNIMAFIATLAMASVWEGFAYIMCGGKNVPIEPKSFFAFGTGKLLGIPVPIIIMIILFLIYGLIMSSTRFGRRVYMCGGNANAARLAGMDPKKLTNKLFLNAGVLSALGGVILTSRMHQGQPGAALGQEFDAITAAVLGGVAFTGGTGTMSGIFLGLMILNFFTNALSVVGLGTYYQIVAKGVLLIAALLLDYFRTRGRIKRHEV